ncbi:MAG: hypothetical protein U0521_25340 [Anaerolineae bacterium]
MGWWNILTGVLIPPTDAAGNALASVMLDAGGFADTRVVQSAEDSIPAAAEFGGLIRLQGYQLDDDTLTLVWDVLAPPPDDYTVFVQVLDSAGNLVGQGDAPPSLPTHYWRSGERFLMRHVITYTEPPDDGENRLIVGWYRPDDFTRLATDSPDNATVLTTFARVNPAQ